MPDGGQLAEGHIILTAAHVCANSTFIQVKLSESPDRHMARVYKVLHECDLAMLIVDEANSFEVRLVIHHRRPAASGPIRLAYPGAARSSILSPDNWHGLWNPAFSHVCSVKVPLFPFYSSVFSCALSSNSENERFLSRAPDMLRVQRRQRGAGDAPMAGLHPNAGLKDSRACNVLTIWLLWSSVFLRYNPTEALLSRVEYRYSLCFSWERALQLHARRLLCS